ncbi:hypothetical protein FQA39_LY00363 [Lamprigera yunnana]|nr:hypothetical protein FQA39_LY00363 [Lamprigera yunnana]
MYSNDMELLRLDSDRDIVEIYLPAAEVKRAKSDYTPFVTDLVYTQQLFTIITVKRRAVKWLKALLKLEKLEICRWKIYQVKFTKKSKATKLKDQAPVATLMYFGLWQKLCYSSHCMRITRRIFVMPNKRKHVWSTIQEGMAAHNYFRGAAKLERKWTDLMRVYHTIKGNKGPKRTGRVAQISKFYERIDEIVEDKPSNNLGSSTVLDICATDKILHQHMFTVNPHLTVRKPEALSQKIMLSPVTLPNNESRTNHCFSKEKNY